MQTLDENILKPMEDQPAKPQYIREQHNHNCQQFFGPVTGCVFAMPGATVHQYPNGADAASPTKPAPPKTQPATRNPQLIIDYVMRLHPAHVRQEWQGKYRALWEEVLQMPEVDSVVFDKGRQQNTAFNRNLVANILHLMAEEKVMTIEAHATKMAEVLEGDPQASVRAQLGVLPTDRRLTSSITALIKQKGKESQPAIHS